MVSADFGGWSQAAALGEGLWALKGKAKSVVVFREMINMVQYGAYLDYN